jgi:hypothetical protein
MTASSSFLEILGQSLFQAADMLRDIADLLTSTDLWRERRVAIGGEEISVRVAEDDKGMVRGVLLRGLLGLFQPPLGEALFEHVLWASRAMGEDMVSAIIRTEWERGMTWAMMGKTRRGTVVVEAWSEEASKTVRVSGQLPRRHPWLRAGTQPPVPYLRAFSRKSSMAFSGLLADFASAGDLDWEFTAVTFLAAASFSSLARRACSEKACDFALLGGSAGAILTARGMERALMWMALQQEDRTVVELLPADAPRPVWSFTLCRKHASELPPLRQSGKSEEAQ